MESDEEDFVFYGTPIERADDTTTSRKKKAVAEAAGQLRALPAWKQEVTDEEGRRRFHGAFTGGYSAGYYNTVGSKEGWTPQTFTSSRKNRAEVKRHDLSYFLDEDEKAAMEDNSLSTSLQFDTFGFTAAEFARKQADKEQQKRPSAIPGPIPDEIVLPATNSIGVKLLLKMGWRHGHSIKDSRTNSHYDARREARKAFLAFSSKDDARPPGSEYEADENDRKGDNEESIDDVVHTSQSTPVFVLNPKQDMHGLGYDPYKHAPEFREKKRLRVSGNREPGNRRTLSVKENLFASKSGKVAPGFGIGALEELDDEDEDVYASGYNFEETYVQDIEEPSSKINTDIKRILGKDEQSVLQGYKFASNSDFQLERFDPPIIPIDFEPHHKFPAALEFGKKLSGPPPPEVPPPDDKNLRLLIDGFAALVARGGKLLEDLSREKHKSNPLFCFLSGGNGHEYYIRKLWEEQQKRNDQSMKYVDMTSVPSVQKMTSESRGRVLGERPLERSSADASLSVASVDSIQLQFHLSDTFTNPAFHVQSEFPEVAKPFNTDPAKQERFERFLKEKYQGGLRSTDSGGNSNMSESDRARERLDFEAAAEAIQKAKSGSSTQVSSSQHLMAISSSNLQFTSGGLEDPKATLVEEQKIKKMYPKREEYQWRPSSILCKRFDITDPYMGKAPPPPRPRGRIDSLIFTPDFVKTTNAEESFSVSREPLSASSELQVTNGQAIDKETGIEPNSLTVERPVDLYKAIFSDDSDDEGMNDSSNKVQDPEKKTEVANTTLNRLIAGDFLESLGKELGLEVPPEPQVMNSKVNNSASEKDTITTHETEILQNNGKPSSTLTANEQLSNEHGLTRHSFRPPENIGTRISNGNEIDHGNQPIGRQGNLVSHLQNSSEKAELPDNVTKVMSAKSRSKRHRSYSSSDSSEDDRNRRHSRRQHRSRSSSPSSEDKRARTHSKRHRSKDSISDSDSFDDEHGSRSYSRSRKKKSSSRGKSSKREHSKHRSSRSKDSPSRHSRHGSSREHRKDRKDGKKSSDDRGRDLVSPNSDSRRRYR